VTFSQPGAGGDQFNAADHNGHLLIVYPKSYQDEVQTKNGNSSAADVDIIIVDKLGPDGKPMAFHNARLFGNLARSVRNDVGGQVLGRLGQGPNTRGTPPWILANFTDADVAAATPVDAAYKAGQFAPTPQPAGAPAAPAQQYAPAPGAGAPVPVPPQQQWQPPAQQQWTPAPQAAPAAAPQATPTVPPQQQWQAPSTAPTPPAAAPAPAPAAAPIDPNLVAYLQSRGIQVQPGMSQADCEAIAASLPQ
jgi:hypothetical protein